jgi:capsular exopolysaccharide synthesis family protein
VCSVSAEEGKSTTVAHLAVSLAQSGQSVLVLDADLRRPTLHRRLGSVRGPGLSELLVASGERDAMRYVRGSRYPGVAVLPAGRGGEEAARALGVSRLDALFAQLAERFRWILIDTPPLFAVPDALRLCPMADGVLMVVAAGSTPGTAIQRGLSEAQGVGGRPLGLVLNKVNLRRDRYYYSRYLPEYLSAYGDAVGPGKGKRVPDPPRVPRKGGALGS